MPSTSLLNNGVPSSSKSGVWGSYHEIDSCWQRLFPTERCVDVVGRAYLLFRRTGSDEVHQCVGLSLKVNCSFIILACLKGIAEHHCVTLLAPEGENQVL